MIAGLEKTGGVITSAGPILAGTFAALMALELEALFQVGFTVSLGLLVDAFLVRTFLVPSIALLLGERNWWPGRWPISVRTSHSSGKNVTSSARLKNPTPEDRRCRA